MNNIPHRFLSKMDTYEITINGQNVKAKYLDRKDMVDSSISGILSQNLMRDLTVVGIDVKSQKTISCPRLLLIYVESRCLIIDVGHMSQLPSSLLSFLANNEICFVGQNMSSLISTLGNHCYNESGNFIDTRTLLKSGVEICQLAARVMKNRALKSCGSLVELANETGFDFEGEADYKNMVCPEWKEASWFTNNEVKYAIHDAYLCYNIGKMLISTLK